MKQTVLRFYLMVAFCTLIFYWNSFGQTQKQLKFNHITLRQGLSQSTGHDILQDNEGFIWFGTKDGLNRYDGYDITVYKHNKNDSTSLSGNSAFTLFEDSRKNMWVGTNVNGLNRYIREKDHFVSYKANPEKSESSISNNSITEIIEDNHGRLWIATLNGLNWYLPGKNKFKHWFSDSDYKDSTNVHSISNSTITALGNGNDGHIWVGTFDGLNRWNPETKEFTRFMHDPDDPTSISENHILEIYKDSDGTIWIGTSGGGLNYFVPEKEEFRNYTHNPNDPRSISGNSVYTLFEDSKGTFWVGTENEGLNSLDRKTGKFYHYENQEGDQYSLSDNTINSLYESRDGILWIGTFAGGINFVDLKEPRFEHYRHNPLREYQLSNNLVNTFLEDSYGNFWIGTDGGGLNLFNRSNKRFKAYTHQSGNKNSPASNVILDLVEDSRQNIWIGYYHGGVSKFDPETFTFEHYQHIEGDTTSLSDDDIFVVHEDEMGNIWFGTNGKGINRYDSGDNNFQRYLTNLTIRSIQDAGDGALWVGTYGQGLIYFDPATGNTRAFTESNTKLESNVIKAIYPANKDSLWLGTQQGLTLFDRDHSTFRTYNTTDGLANDVINGILKDQEGIIWLSTNSGISKFNPTTDEFTNYGPDDGLQSRQFNPHSYYKDREGYMYFGGINGFNRFKPENIRIDQTVSPVTFTDFKIFNKTVPVSDDSYLPKQISQIENITLPYDASVISFEYTALNFHHIKDIDFAYKLEGFDREWHYVGSNRTATYTNLDPGQYEFQVKASNSDNIWNKKPEILTLTITPPFWQTYWFYTLSILFVGGTVFLAYRMKVRSIHQQNEWLERKVSARTSELNQKNRDLEQALDELKQTRSKLVEKAHKAGMADLATGILHNVGNILNSINVSASIINETLRNSGIYKFRKANRLLREHIDEIEDFVINDPKSKKLFKYYLLIEEPINQEFEILKTQKDRLQQKVDLIVEVITAQQNFSRADMVSEKVDIKKLFKDAITLQSGKLERHGVKVKSKYEHTSKVTVEKTKVMHIIFNLMKNAIESMQQAEITNKVLQIESWEEQDYVHVSVKDNGMGIKEEYLDKVFNHGFTTKKKGYGFGLHSCANYMSEMNGKMAVKSKGRGEGAQFILSFPVEISSKEIEDQEE